ncbi:FAD-dependent oxidoreductase [Baekduia soli]|uniref:FAD-dependent oxidoreductase n=1 Tax=Baekduia soli TaxID=496014 RepID=A0A5B8U7U0_9ACTN|nr:FAD-dependent oxidoreductase [Baekduia soli]QEC49011.1 FAD-dependent oxidoreductase [Baekduia soli]
MPRPWPKTPPSRRDRAAYADAAPVPFWLDTAAPRAPDAPLEAPAETDLCIVGGGFTGLWAALHAKAADPAREVVLLEADRIGAGASGRNGGFVVASLTHGLVNGLARFADELDVLERLAAENYDGLRADLDRHGIDAHLDETGELTALLEPHEVARAEHEAGLLRRFGHNVEVLDRDAMRAELDSPTYLGGLWDRTGAGILDPGRLADGLRYACRAAGVRLHEHSPATGLREAGAGVVVATPGATLTARRVLLATSAYPPLLRALRRYVVPVYDYVLVSEPLDAARLDAIGWRHRQGIGDGGNDFHYYRMTRDDRILWGGFDAVYRRGGPVGPQFDTHDPTFARLAQNFFVTFPQLDGLRFTHRWGGAIDTCSRFSVFFGTAHGGRVAHATGYTGLGVAATRFGARVALDLLDGRDTEATRLRYVRRRPVPFPPEPLRTGVIRLTQNRLAAADARQGRRGLWLGTLDRLGLGFDS